VCAAPLTLLTSSAAAPSHTLPVALEQQKITWKLKIIIKKLCGTFRYVGFNQKRCNLTHIANFGAELE
jgi:hypothetical protein